MHKLTGMWTFCSILVIRKLFDTILDRTVMNFLANAAGGLSDYFCVATVYLWHLLGASKTFRKIASFVEVELTFVVPNHPSFSGRVVLEWGKITKGLFLWPVMSVGFAYIGPSRIYNFSKYRKCNTMGVVLLIYSLLVRWDSFLVLSLLSNKRALQVYA